MGTARRNSGSATGTVHRLWQRLTRRVWQPTAVYEAIPWLYCALGGGALAAGLYLPHAGWILPYVALLTAGCLHFGLWCLALRRRYRCRVLRRKRARRSPLLS